MWYLWSYFHTKPRSKVLLFSYRKSMTKKEKDQHLTIDDFCTHIVGAFSGHTLKGKLPAAMPI